jgi:hypothetical protein
MTMTTKQRTKGQVYDLYLGQDRELAARVKAEMRSAMGNRVTIKSGQRIVRFDSVEFTVYCVTARFRVHDDA